MGLRQVQVIHTELSVNKSNSLYENRYLTLNAVYNKYIDILYLLYELLESY